MASYERSTVTWDGIELEIGFAQDWPIAGFCHIEIKCDVPLPITETGYKSHFMPLANLDGFQDHIAFVFKWLEHEATKPAWKRFKDSTRQGELFEF